MKNWLLILFLFVPLVVVACAKNDSTFFQDTGKKMDQGMHKTGDKIHEGLNKAGDEIEKGLDKAGEKVKDATD